MKQVDFLEKVDIGLNFVEHVFIFSISSASTEVFCLFNTSDKDLKRVVVKSEVSILIGVGVMMAFNLLS